MRKSAFKNTLIFSKETAKNQKDSVLFIRLNVSCELIRKNIQRLH